MRGVANEPVAPQAAIIFRPMLILLAIYSFLFEKCICGFVPFVYKIVKPQVNRKVLKTNYGKSCTYKED
jgi:hypothetical protein